MSRDKQIEEMWKVMQKSNAVTYEPNAHRVDLYVKGQKEKFYVSEQDGHLTINYGILAKALYNSGYRKSTDLAREIFEEIDKLAYRFMNDKHYIFGDMVYDLAELKKKYESENINENR